MEKDDKTSSICRLVLTYTLRYRNIWLCTMVQLMIKEDLNIPGSIKFRDGMTFTIYVHELNTFLLENMGGCTKFLSKATDFLSHMLQKCGIFGSKMLILK